MTIDEVKEKLAKVESEYNDCLAEYNSAKDRLENLRKQVFDQRAELNQRVSVADAEPEVTYHSIIRYLERFEGVNVSEIEEKLLTDKARDYINNFITGEYTGEDGITRVFVNKKIVTVKQ